MIATGSALPDVLDRLVRLVEQQSDGMRCSVLLLDDDGTHVRHGAAPSLPDDYVRAIDGSAHRSARTAPAERRCSWAPGSS